ncbi:ParB/Srx family N-terminal domain-containing protein [Mycobacterium spongiae]|uniref:Chromosome partitioning protein ParB n=1 Tax=Mycobacterium spongiae TaxID=886343 RepID=A0A975JU41_9MYCO|nr:ParB/Srx family N-terminal domain-containing protein [Mycobacterium spongiae]QUR65737.1 chromosome partitioning protein ParB [Mycobacterium spongiae]
MAGIGRRTVAAGFFVVALTVAACSAPSGERSGAATPSGASEPCAEQNARYCAAEEGDLLEVTLGELRPTQPSLGYDEVYYRLGRYTLGAGAADQLLDQWCVTNGQDGLAEADQGATLAAPTSFRCQTARGSETAESTAPMKTVVIGPGGQPYLTDGHHTLTSFWEAPGGGPGIGVRLKVTGNLSSLEPEAFWDEMQSRGWTWLRDAHGKPITPDQLPIGLGLKQFANDRYRGALYFVRDVGFIPDDDRPEFQEFYWGHWLREQTDPKLSLQSFDLDQLASYLSLVGNFARAIVALPPDTVIAAERTAADLGKMDSFGQQAFDGLGQPVDSAKPGKLAYAIAYKAGR